jgi:transposase InsO family protein
MRWCSDGFEIPCWNGEIVRVAFTMDTCDRETITRTATTAGISGGMLRDIMLVAIENAFAISTRRIALNSSPITVAATQLTKLSTSPFRSALCRVSRQFAAPNQTV